MAIEKFLLRSICVILALIILITDHDQYEKINQCEKLDREILQMIKLNIELERFKDEILTPDLPPLFPFPLHKKDLKEDEYA